MAVYKVPQDVEADDKLIGPFSFRQFVYLIIVAAALAIGYFLSRLFIPLAIIPLPIILFFGALALPLRKDQPMETYLAAIVSFYIKPRKRLWDPDGQQALVEITAPRTVEVQRTKDLTQDEAERRLSYLANVVDSRGWSVRGAVAPEVNTSMNSDMYFEAQQVEDVFDANASTAHVIDDQLDQASVRHREELMARMQNPVAATAAPAQAPVFTNPYSQIPEPTQPAAQSQPLTTPPEPVTTTTTPADEPKLTFNPYPTNMHQSVIQPMSAQPQPAAPTVAEPPQETTSETSPSPDIINLANNPDLSIETIAHEANRIKQKQGLPDDEVVISLH